jgi:hypothetical protein
MSDEIGMTGMQRDFQLLGDGDDDYADECDYNNKYTTTTNNTKIINTIKIQTKTNPVTMTVNVKSFNNNNNNNNNNFNVKQAPKRTSTSSTTATTPTQTQTLNRFNISPNKPPTPGTEQSRKYEFKAIERPRSRPHSPLSLMRGIEEYAQQYASSNSINNSSQKITMNLKMDDLLANSVKNETYQMLDDFSVLTGDIEELVSGENSFKSRAKKAKPSNYRTSANDGDDADKSGDDDDDNDDGGENDDEQFDTDKEERNKGVYDEKGKLKYKYTASYKIDEATGSFKENSKIVFENKNNIKSPIRPPPPPMSPSTTTSASASSQQQPTPPQSSFKAPTRPTLLYSASNGVIINFVCI